MHTLSFSILWQLFRWLPVVAWSYSAFLLGFLLAVKDIGWQSSFYIDILLVFLAGGMLQGIAAHAFNDVQDWQSGTDVVNNNKLSGGSKVLKYDLITKGKLYLVGIAALLVAVIVTVYFVFSERLLVLLVLAVGIWAAVTYTMPPLRLSYRPFLGEWLAAFPAVAVCTLGSYYILTGELTRPVIVAGSLHGLFSLGWLMHHHLQDIHADLSATPPKITTVAYIFIRYGLNATKYLVASYFFITMLAAVWAWISLGQWFISSALAALFCVIIAISTNLNDPVDITRRELALISITIVNAISLGFIINA